jgi:hypothetical protein
MFLQNIGIYVQDETTSQLGRPTSTVCKPVTADWKDRVQFLVGVVELF